MASAELMTRDLFPLLFQVLKMLFAEVGKDLVELSLHGLDLIVFVA